MQIYQWEEGIPKGLLVEKEGSKSQPHQIIMALGLRALKFNGIVNKDFLKIQSKSE